MSGNRTSERLVSKLRALHLLPDGQPVELVRTFSNQGSKRAGKWIWLARNPVTRQPYNVGSRFTMQAILDAPELVTCETMEGTSVNVAGTAPRYEVRPG